MKKKISQFKDHYVICGFGRVGAAAVESLKIAGADFVIIERTTEHCRAIRERGYFCLEGDATSETSLIEAGVKRAKGLLALLDSDPSNLFIALTARELNPTLHIIARIEDVSSEKKILQAGADRVISAFSTAGKKVADDILSATGMDATSTRSSVPKKTVVRWVQVSNESDLTGRTIGEACRVLEVRPCLI